MPKTTPPAAPSENPATDAPATPETLRINGVYYVAAQVVDGKLARLARKDIAGASLVVYAPRDAFKR